MTKPMTKPDYTPLQHAAVALATQVFTGVVLNDWLLGAAFGIALFLGREHAQAEYRWIEKYGQGKRANMPQWGGFDYRVWNVSSLLDFVSPVIACTVTYFAALALGVV